MLNIFNSTIMLNMWKPPNNAKRPKHNKNLMAGLILVIVWYLLLWKVNADLFT
jgi:hypothetical protein